MASPSRFLSVLRRVLLVLGLVCALVACLVAVLARSALKSPQELAEIDAGLRTYSYAKFSLSPGYADLPALPLRRTEHAVQSRRDLGDGSVLLDFGKARFGTLHLAGAGDPLELEVTLHELPLEGPALNVHNRVSLRRHRALHVFSQAAPDLPLPERHVPRAMDLPQGPASVLPFRYAVVRDAGGQPLPEGLEFTQSALSAPLPGGVTHLDTSDAALNTVWDLARHTILATTFAGVFLDGERERLPYEADALIGQMALAVLNPDPTMARRSYQVMEVKPTWPLEWQFALIDVAWFDYQATGDLDLLRARLSDLEERVFWEATDPDSGLLQLGSDLPPVLEFGPTKLKPIIDWPPSERRDIAYARQARDFGDWGEIALNYIKAGYYKALGLDFIAGRRFTIAGHSLNNREIPGDHFAIQAVHFHALETLRSVYGALGDAARADDLTALITRKRASLQALYADPDSGLFLDRPRGTRGNLASFHSNLFAFAYGLAAPEHAVTVQDFVVENKYKASVYTANLMLDTFYAAGLGAEALDYITQSGPRGYVQMVTQHGSDMLMESWDEGVKSNLDWNHVWGAGVAYSIIADLVGLDPLAQSPARMTLAPKPAGLARFEAVVETRFGPVPLRYRRTGAETLIEVEVPATWPLRDLVLRPGAGQRITAAMLDGQPVDFGDAAAGLLAVRPGGLVQIRMADQG